MPWWGWLIIAIVLLVSSVSSSIYAGNKAFDANLRNKMLNGENVYGRFAISDATTNSEYFYGCKYCKVSEFVYIGKFRSFRSSFCWIYQFEKSIEVGGVECKVVFWAGGDPGKPLMYVTEEGTALLEGNIGLRV